MNVNEARYWYDSPYRHGDGKKCVLRGDTFYKKGEGLGENARCKREHPEPDDINHPDHYKWLPVEAIDITENFNFTMGNALKYIIRADHKDNALEDLKKARWYIDREIKRREQLPS